MRGVSTKIVRGTKRVWGFPLFFGIRLYNPAEKKRQYFCCIVAPLSVCAVQRRESDVEKRLLRTQAKFCFLFGYVSVILGLWG